MLEIRDPGGVLVATVTDAGAWKWHDRGRAPPELLQLAGQRWLPVVSGGEAPATKVAYTSVAQAKRGTPAWAEVLREYLPNYLPPSWPAPAYVPG